MRENRAIYLDQESLAKENARAARKPSKKQLAAKKARAIAILRREAAQRRARLEAWFRQEMPLEPRAWLDWCEAHPDELRRLDASRPAIHFIRELFSDARQDEYIVVPAGCPVPSNTPHLSWMPARQMIWDIMLPGSPQPNAYGGRERRVLRFPVAAAYAGESAWGPDDLEAAIDLATALTLGRRARR